MYSKKYKVVLNTSDGETVLDSAVSFSLTKERYTPYFLFEGEFIGSCEPKEVTSVYFYYDGVIVHSGIPDKIVCQRKGSVSFVKIRSYGYTMLLGQNQSVPGMLSSPNLDTLLSGDNTIYGVGYQSDSDTVNYLYINEDSTIWDAVCIYAMKAYGTYPFIVNKNAVRCTRDDSESFTYEDEKILSASDSMEITGIISDAYTQDINDEWTYHYSNEFAEDKKITKRKYSSRDKEWLYDLNDQLKFQVYNSDRKRVIKQFTYCGYKGEELLDRATVSFDDFSVTDGEIDLVKLEGTSKGIFTTIGFYYDSFCNA